MPVEADSASRLLVVDDEPDLRTLYEMSLLREGHVVDTAGSVEEARLRLQGRHYALVISDMRLPDGSGLELLQWLEAQGRPEKTIIITAYGSAENAVEALKAGAFDYLTKPVDLRQFRMVVASALGRPGAAPAKVGGAAVRTAPLEASAGPAKPARASRETAREPVRESVREPAGEPSAVPVLPEPSSGRALSSAPSAAATGEALHGSLERLAGTSAAMQQVRALVAKVARSMAPVLVQGESGTGKELVARAIHDVGERSKAPFIAVNCGAIPEHLLEAEFFGYRKGAFTGAQEDREGFFQAAQGGTLFLDEIGELPLAMQSKLLRAIQERSVRPVGAVVETPVNLRLLSATHRDLSAEVAAGRFRQDLFYRLNVIQIRVPPLRERMEDLPQISQRVMARIAQDAGISPAPYLSPAALQALGRYGFPGNVRELENLLHRALALSGAQEIEAADLGLPGEVLDDPQFATADSGFVPLHEGLSDALPGGAVHGPEDTLPTDLAAYLDEVERRILIRALDLHQFNRTAAGAALGLSLRQMRYRMARLQIQAPDGGPGDAQGL